LVQGIESRKRRGRVSGKQSESGEGWEQSRENREKGLSRKSWKSERGLFWKNETCFEGRESEKEVSSPVVRSEPTKREAKRGWGGGGGGGGGGRQVQVKKNTSHGREYFVGRQTEKSLRREACLGEKGPGDEAEKRNRKEGLDQKWGEVPPGKGM